MADLTRRDLAKAAGVAGAAVALTQISAFRRIGARCPELQERGRPNGRVLRASTPVVRGAMKMRRDPPPKKAALDLQATPHPCSAGRPEAIAGATAAA